MIIDVSKWQGKIDWNTVKIKNPLITGVYIKSSEGIGYSDPNFLYNAEGAIKAGFKVGFYHFASLNDHNEVGDATKEANYFSSLIKNFDKHLPTVLDIETNLSALSKDEVITWIITFFAILRNNNITDYSLYSYGPFLNENLPVGHKLGNVPLWIANYTPSIILPHGWDKYWLWQYTQDGFVAGINGKVDLNREFNT